MREGREKKCKEKERKRCGNKRKKVEGDKRVRRVRGKFLKENLCKKSRGRRARYNCIQ